ncbi:aldehyde dehydrogenase family protein, partial [Oscillatoriales cyanobacterium LEGE 11467]
MSQPIPVRNPRTGITDYEIVPPTANELGEVCVNVRQAQPAWQQLGVEGRIAVMQQWKQALLKRKEEIVAALVADTGRLSESVMEIDGVISSLDSWCRLTPQILAADTAQPTAIPTIELQQQWVPYPLVGIVSPWNFPLLLSLIDAIPALLAGCGAIVKP